MEKRIMANICRYCLIITALSFITLAAHAQVLINPGFETAGTNYVFPDTGDGQFPIITNISALGWTVNGGYAARTLTNSPQQGSYEEAQVGQDYYGINQSGTNVSPGGPLAFPVTSRSGQYSLRTFGPFVTACCQGSGAVQLISSNQNAAVSNNTIWVVSGYAMNWSGDPMFDQGIDITGFGLIQVAFYDVTNSLIGTPVDGPHLDTNTVLDTWISCSVTATAPPGTVSVGAWALHVGQDGAFGSVFFDDMSITNIGVAPPPPPIVTNQFQAVIQKGNQVCFPTISTASYLPQSSDDGSAWANIGSPMPGDGNTDCVFAVTHKFYRVYVLQ